VQFGGDFQRRLPPVSAVSILAEDDGAGDRCMGDGVRGQTCAIPPSAKSSIALTKLASGETRKSAAPAISAGSATAHLIPPPV
jgi:hypothetical protein